MIWLDKEGNVVIKTNIPAKEVYEVLEMKKCVLDLLATQDENFHNRDSNWWAYRLIELLEPNADQIQLQELKEE